MKTQARLRIKGDVIGVGFRAWTKIQARRLGITGWIRNVHSSPEIYGRQGGVEALIQGEGEAVNTLMEIVKTGSPISRVDSVDILHVETFEEFDDFTILKSVASSFD